MDLPPRTVAGIEYLEPAGSAAPLPEDGLARVRVSLSDGKTSAFAVAAMAGPGRWLAKDKAGFKVGDPRLYVKDFTREAVARAVEWMCADMGGFWLRYYNSERKSSVPEPPPPPKPVRVVKVDLLSVETDGGPEASSGVLEVYLSDAREFSVLAATPAWFERKAGRLGLDFYYGHSILFLRKIGPDLAKKSARELAKNPASLCLYDTPRTTLARVLEDFKARH